MSVLLDRRAREHFEALSHDEKIEAVYWLRDAGFTAHGIAHATQMSIEQIREVLAARPEPGL